MLSTGFLLILAKVVFETAPVFSQSLHASENPIPVGSNVTLYAEDAINTGVWSSNSTVIAVIYPGGQTINEKWRERATLNFTANRTSLAITSLRVEDSGEYRLQKIQSNSKQYSVQLSVQEPISNVTIKAQATDLVEYNDSAVFTCSQSSGTSLSYTWLNGSHLIAAGERVQLSDGGANLTINVTRYDQGPFSCNVSNGISHEVSTTVGLRISYGPSNAMMSAVPSKVAYRTGDNTTLACSADSSPAARIWWMVNGRNLNKTGPHLQLQNVTESDSGNYTCVFHNNVTSRFTGKSKMIKILAPLTEASVHTVGSPPILNSTFALTCRTTGVVESIAWMHNWSPVYSDKTRNLSMDNATLTFDPLMMSDSGNYSCMASNWISNITSKHFILDVYYGPEMSSIFGPPVARVGHNVTLVCLAPSNPPSSYKWIFNGSVVADTAVYVTPTFTAEVNWTYTCVAHNNITDKNSTAHKTIIALYPITGVQIESPMKAAVEGQLYKLTCNVTGPPSQVYWFKNGHHVDNQTIFFSGDRKIIMFNPLQIGDAGNYSCSAMNAVSHMTSLPYMLRVNFGPETPAITGPNFAEMGTVAHFSCSANSYPPSVFTWWFNGSEVANTSAFRTAPLSFNMSGQYTCMAYNDVTGGNSSATTMLTVVGPTELVITSSGVPIHHRNFSLTCEVTGSHEQIYWLKDGVRLNTTSSLTNQTMSNQTMSNQTMPYRTENYTLHFPSLTLYDDGEYKCVVNNQASEHQSAAFILRVNYGPLKVHISGPDSAQAGSSVTLACTADSRPDCDFYWNINGQGILKTGPVINFTASKASEGTYTCVARNPVTDLAAHRSKVVAVVGKGAALQAPSFGPLLSLSVFAFSLNALLN